ncbi:hypothetical protein C8J57DRAFT_1704391 [Mycena rebaudengoi]|nr:hypothetical protein C8J57DRAFT_1704391 [Mycena rebaudengoi]
MGFCRRCGDIVTGDRCKCGGMAVAPVVPWNQANPKEKTQDRWSKTYVSKDRSPSPTRRANPEAFFMSQSSAPAPLGTRVSAHITSTTSQLGRPPSPLKYSALVAPEEGILPSPTPHDTTLSKVYGSVLQPRESLSVHSCAICAMPFPDSTIYPDPYGSTSPGPPRFFCRSCFITNGGSRGTCAACSRPVLILKTEGGFIHAADKYWHKRCFDCAGCYKNIGDSPMVDLLGRPSCVDCFDNCLDRDSTPKKSRSSTSSPRVEKIANLGGMGGGSKARSRESSPALQELEQRLGLKREASPELEDLSHRLSLIGKDSPSRSPRVSAYSGSSSNPALSRMSTSSRESSPLHGRSRVKSDPLADLTSSLPRRYERLKSTEAESGGSPSARYSPASPSPMRHTSPAPTEEAIEEMKRRFMKGPSSSPAATPPRSTRSLRSSRSFGSGSLSSPTIPPTPDLTSDFSDTTSSSGPNSPPRDNETGNDDVDVFNVSKVFAQGYGSRYTRDFLGNVDDVIVEETKSQMGTPTHTPKSTVKTKATPTKSPIPFPTQSQSKSPKGLSIVPPKLSSSNCAKCRHALFAVEEGGRYVTVPDDATGEPRTYHTVCFTCVSCDKPFKEGTQGQAIFVKGEDGPCHVECAPRQKINIRPISASSSSTTIFSKADSTPSSRPPSAGAPPTATFASSSKYDRPPFTAPPTSTPSAFPRFGTNNSCPGCHKSVSPMERGVVPGPQGSRWHATCLVCGGKKELAKGWNARAGDQKKKGVPGCGKKLDSAAKGDGEGGIWCRECSLLLPVGMRGSPQGSPTRPMAPTYTGNGALPKVAPQYTGTTTIARQFTGYGGDPGIFRQLTGGGLSPTRSISPTKGMMTSSLRTRPKSVVGIRNTNIVRQMTGSGL